MSFINIPQEVPTPLLINPSTKETSKSGNLCLNHAIASALAILVVAVPLATKDFP